MSESGLSAGWSDLKKVVGFALGHGRGVARAWTATELSEISDVVQSGVRRVYYPEAINVDTVGYEWSWLRPTKTLAIISGDYDYDLPDDFGRLIGTLHYPANEHRDSIIIVSVGKLLQLRSSYNLSGAPTYAATRYKISTGATGQRQEILFYPKPDKAWTLSYEYEAYSGALSDTYPYPLGGMQLAEIYIESCLAIIESRIQDEAGIHTQQFKALLVDAIARDKKRGARVFGPMGHVESAVQRFRHGDTSGTYSITYHGDSI